ncbi:sensor histidine kinase [Pedobacter glucosidilyticus]|uniref:sensor histidine kinase n=1 Tax=Pedobacter glucosidilyticus TaxID=1122941 RepID=UPI000686AA4F|nr:ATP-binding protein [Pedobacter glucosidilyticus]
MTKFNLHKIWYSHIWNTERMTNKSNFKMLLVPLLLSILAMWFKISFFNHYFFAVPYLMFISVILISASYGGCKSAFFATLITFSIVVYLLFSNSYLLKDHFEIIAFQAVIFLLNGLLISALVRYIQMIYSKLLLSKEKYRSMVEQIEEGFLMLDRDGIILYSSPSVTTFLGYQEQELKGKSLATLLHQQEVNDFTLFLMKLIAHKGNFKKKQFRFVTIDNTQVWAELSISNLLQEANIKALVLHFSNVTDRLEKEKQQEDFIHMATHELKSPVTVLKGYLQLLTQKMSIDKSTYIDFLQMLAKMDSQLNRLLGLITDMLESTHIKAGELNYHFSLFNLTACVKDCIEGIKAANPQYQFVYNLANETILIEGDKDRIAQVIINFLTNAIKYSPGKYEVHIRMLKQLDEVKVCVRDFGIGIAKDKQQAIFDRFYRVDTLPKNTFMGLGLGLYIAAEIVLKHGGKIGVDSDVGRGSEFWFSLPFIK